ncbi:YqaJ viral recombinase family protein [Mucilaginibacter sp. 10I4]|uniref:lambda exonuclease family protein n=1 Tax=Mucilaginibacter sp. 10I4 TaxID=3048580 RepID=UPI002B23EA2B|nr:YqaJ viral recombinase family protein [Mucilaginibacter sp. 10I4]MEB0262877.1 YqaJ viral recombinase family protein [Mucilaginibacter sp. 10I4]
MNGKSFIEPHTQQWKEVRLGRFTSSEIHKLFQGGKRSLTPEELKGREKGDLRRTADTLFGEGALTYIKVKIAEILTGEAKEATSTSMDWGLSLEADAIQCYAKNKNAKPELSGFYTFNSIYGGSPDAEIGNDGILEVKCPFASENHISIMLCKSVEELRNFNEAYYTQPQGNMFVTGAKWCDFISYDPRCKNEKFRIKIIRIDRDENLIKDMVFRLEKAADIMNDYFNDLIEI